MKWLYSPESNIPIRVKAVVRWLIIKVESKRGKFFEVTYYEDGETAPELDAIGWIEYNGSTIAFVNNHGGLRYYW